MVDKNLLRRDPVILVLLMALLAISAHVPPFRRTPAFDVFAGIVALVLIRFAAVYLFRFISGKRNEPGYVDEAPRFGLPRSVFWILFIVVGGPLIYGIITEGSDFASRRMDIYLNAKRELLFSNEARGIFGNDLKIGWPIELNASVGSDEGHAEMSVPLLGDRAKGNMYLSGIKANGKWTITELYILQKGSTNKIQLKH